MLAPFPNATFGSVVPPFLDVPAKAYRVSNVRSFDFPWVAILEPVVRDLNLFPIFNNLLEDTIIVSYAVAPSWYLESSKTVQETSG